MTENIKPFRTWDQQIERLKTKYDLKIEDDNFARRALSSMSYYDLVNGYSECFMKDGKYTEAISIEYLYSFYHFDRTFQNALFQYSIYIENFFKTALSYVVAESFGIYQKEYLNQKNYVNPKNQKRRRKRTQLLEKLHKTYNPENKYLDNPTKHYVETKNHVPPWILFKNVSFSNAIDLYSFLKSEEKYKVRNIVSPGVDPEAFKNSLTVVRKYRNAIAHNLKFVTYRSGVNYIPSVLSIDKLQPFTEMENLKNDSPYNLILAIVLLLNDAYLLNELYESLSITITRFTRDPRQVQLFQDYSRITGIPINILEIFQAFILKLE